MTSRFLYILNDDAFSNSSGYDIELKYKVNTNNGQYSYI